MKNISKIVISLGVVFIATLFVVYEHSKFAAVPATPTEVASVPQVDDTLKAVSCPYVFAQNGEIKMTALDCSSKLDSTGAIIPEDYVAKKLTIDTKNAHQEFAEGIEFTTSEPQMNAIDEDSNDNYVYYGGGSWLIHGLTIYRMADGKTATIEFREMKKTDSGSIVYAPRSTKYPDAHPEVDLSAALDVDAIKLSDFSVSHLCAGDAEYNCRIGKVSTDGKMLAIEKVKWNSNPEAVVPVTQFALK